MSTVELHDCFEVGFDYIPELFRLSKFSVPYLDGRFHQGGQLPACFMDVYLPASPVIQEVVGLMKVGRVRRFRQEVVIGIPRVTSCWSSS